MTTTSDDNSSSPLCRPDPAAVEAAVKRLKELLAKTTPGPWKADISPYYHSECYVSGIVPPPGRPGPNGEVIVKCTSTRSDIRDLLPNADNARFIAAAHELVPVLLAALSVCDEAGETLKTLERLVARGQLYMAERWDGVGIAMYSKLKIPTDLTALPTCDYLGSGDGPTLTEAISALGRQLPQPQSKETP